jgi:hypothetical protein
MPIQPAACILFCQAPFERLAVGRDALVLGVLDPEVVGQIGVQPGAELAAERGVLGRIGEIHGRSPPAVSLSGTVRTLNHHPGTTAQSDRIGSARFSDCRHPRAH